MQLKKRAFLGMIWVFIDYFLVKGVSFVGSIILARILMPSDFGIIAMISIFITLGNILLDSGLSSSLIRNEKNDDDDYSTVFYTNIISGIVIFVSVYLLAPLIAIFFKQDILINIVRLYSVVFLLTSFSSVQMTILIKEMKFKKIAILNLPSVFLGLGVGIFIAYEGYGVWSIITMYLITQFVLSFGLWISSDWKPKIQFSKKKFFYHFNFGYKLLFANILSGTTTNLYGAITGKFYSLKTTGNFERAFTLNNYPLMILTQIIGKVSFPLMAGIQNERERFSEVFVKMVRFTFFINAPLMLILSASSKPLILFLLGDKWVEAVPIFSILCFGGIFYTLQALNINVIKIFGRSDYILKGEIYLKVTMIFIIGISLVMGFNYFLWGIVLNSFLTLLVNMFYCGKVIGITVGEQIKLILPTFAIAIISYGISKLGLVYFDNYTVLNEVFKLILTLVLGTVSYLLGCWILKLNALVDLFNFISERKII